MTVLTLNKSTRRFAKAKRTIEISSVLNTIPINEKWNWGTTQNNFTPVILISLFLTLWLKCESNISVVYELQVETFCCQNIGIVIRFRILASNIHLIKIHVLIPFLLFTHGKTLCLQAQSTFYLFLNLSFSGLWLHWLNLKQITDLVYNHT